RPLPEARVGRAVGVVAHEGELTTATTAHAGRDQLPVGLLHQGVSPTAQPDDSSRPLPEARVERAVCAVAREGDPTIAWAGCDQLPVGLLHEGLGRRTGPERRGDRPRAPSEAPVEPAVGAVARDGECLRGGEDYPITRGHEPPIRLLHEGKNVALAARRTGRNDA